MSKRIVATLGGLLVAGLGCGVGTPMAHANESGGQCNNYGDGSLVIAPFCGASLAPAPVPQQLSPTTGDLRPVIDQLSGPLRPTLDDLKPVTGDLTHAAPIVDDLRPVLSDPVRPQ
jgi:hypothetical protein